ncbi:MAG TPA: DUF1634 domain-containing protein [Candidatus Tectomicrobia bacterium]|jgi:uncharacterized membrane protein
MPLQTWSEQQVEEIVGNLLRGGVVLAAVVVLVGGVLYLRRYGATVPDYRMFHGEPADLRHFSGIVTDATTLRSRGVIQFGLLLLTATPVARVVFAMVAFAQQRDRTYVLVTLIVLTVLIYSLTGGHL